MVGEGRQRAGLISGCLLNKGVRPPSTASAPPWSVRLLVDRVGRLPEPAACSGRCVLAEQRHQLIVRSLRSGGTASVAGLAAQLDASAATIRRDLLKLEADGLITRVHGGALHR
ncbi:DeoR family transcriptional regulator [Streptomyces sp. NPDC002092]